jgi:uncharacterized membrane protein
MNLSESNPTESRIKSVDIIRGVIMVLMAIDHVRVYAGVPAGGPEPAIFFTRWVTHFCAPGFVFLTGVSAFLYGQKINDKNILSRFLLTRGLLLVILELTVIRFSWTFNFNYAEFTLAGVIWMIGWCMVIMAALVRLSPLTVGIFGLAIICVQQLFGLVQNIIPESFVPQFGRFWEFIYPSGLKAMFGINVLYVIVPWIGVMAAGYGFGTVIALEAKLRDKICLSVGIALILCFIVVGSIVAYGKTDELPFILSLLNQNKYPASQLFLAMTLGPIIAVIPFAERAKGWIIDMFMIFGRVPMFYYLLHIPVIHVSALLVNLILSGSAGSESYGTAPFTRIAPEQRWGLGILYAVFFIDLVILFLACQWYATFKESHREIKWLKYL